VKDSLPTPSTSPTDLVAVHDRTDALGGAGEDQVAGFHRHNLAGLGDHLGDVPDHVGDLAALLFLAVDGQEDRAFRRRTAHGADGGDRGAGVEGLAGLPGVALALGGVLQVAAGQVDADGVAEDEVDRLLGGEVLAAALQGRDQLDLVVQVRGRDRIGHGGGLGNDGVARLGEEERRIARVRAHFASVRGVVAPHAEDPAHRKDVGRPLDRNRGKGGGGKGVRRHAA
jgi:hypothetical protein